MKPRTALAVLLLLLFTTAVSVAAFHWHYRDFFYLRRVFRAAGPADRERLLRVFQRRYHDNPGNTALSMMLSEALLRAGDTASAVVVAQRQYRFHPRDTGIRLMLADALAADGQTEKADALLRKLMDELDARSETRRIRREGDSSH